MNTFIHAAGRPESQPASTARMRSFRRRISHSLSAGLVAAVVALGAPASWAQAWPEKGVRFVVPFPPGGAIDTLARLVAQHLGTDWNRPATVENKPGAGGIIGTELVAHAAPDGYTFGWGAVSTHAINVGLYKRLPYDPVKDFAPVAPVALVPNLLVVNSSVPVKSVTDLIEYARKHPGELNYGSAGVGTTLHISCELFKSMAQVDMRHVPYKGSGPALTDLLGGQIPVMCDSVTSALPYIRSGKIRALGITSSDRSVALPQVPTIAEAGLPGYEMNPWFGLFAPAGTPAEIVAKLNADVAKVLAKKEVQERLLAIGAHAMSASPGEFAEMVRKDVAKWDDIVRKAGISAE